ncbi:PilN domain-containing protein [Erwiniaceae bacterium BAC15a-03b]|uniref:PilN domain-containing protein n=1 Tax=Winslowiella arboricola TaxID=2978220 RepID=A0A9J6PJE6_9GAMM|nr:PilN domain-containing protein [Winslowiella arboricola]MCU5771860.1 PilN domain-containing protein [Winslowiella arboricola]MCU5777490.1 PilN domain-containing protein [Winslowiella arboricola]
MVWVNLLPWRQQQLIKQRRGWWLVLLVLVLPGGTVLLMFCQQLATDNQHWRQRLNQLQVAMAQADGLAQKLAQAQQQRHDLLARQQKQQRQQLRNQQWLQFAGALPQLMPQSLWLTSLQQATSGFYISGISHQLEDVAVFRQQLGRQPLFQQIHHGSIERQSNGLMQFSLQASLQQELAYE